jgi:hypothetical protein
MSYMSTHPFRGIAEGFAPADLAGTIHCGYASNFCLAAIHELAGSVIGNGICRVGIWG